ncbi:hypothetical protein ACFE04_010719 [Oxalis oulophora]
MSNVNVSCCSFLLLLIILFNHSTYAYTRSVPTDPPVSTSDFINQSSLFVMAVVIFFLFIFCYLVLVLRGYIFAADSDQGANGGTNRSKTLQGLALVIIDTFPVFTYSKVKEIKIGRGALECAVCLSEFVNEDILRLMPICDHVFHRDCIDMWLSSHVTCPVCRAELSNDDSIKKDDQVINSPATPQIDSNEIVINVNNDDEPSGTISGKYPRSHSTGHSVVLVHVSDSTDRYTLRLPEEVRSEIIATAKLQRTGSLVGDASFRKLGLNNEKKFFDRWIQMIRMSPSTKVVGSSHSDKEGSSNGKALLTAVKYPFNCGNVKVEDVGEPSA